MVKQNKTNSGNNSLISNIEIFSEDFDKKYFYEENDLGFTYSKHSTTFKVWAPTASKVEVNLYEEGIGDCLINSYPMVQGENGIWFFIKSGDLEGIYYTYSVMFGDDICEAVDPYAKAAGVNGERGAILDFHNSNPIDWENDSIEELEQFTDAVIYEIHVRDLGTDMESGIRNIGKFLEFTEENTTNSEGYKTGLDHIKELGITHLHLLPVFDYGTVDETKPNERQFNWGYDPVNYNVIEGSYSTNPYNAKIRVTQFKQMVQCLHKNNIRVVMDVVYNHTYQTQESNLNKVVPDYYYRKDGNKFSNASGCGNETASERKMVRKYIIDSVIFWAKEYHIDGFRFDLMGIHDIETMNQLRIEVDKINPNILLYGEGWTCNTSVLDESLRAMKVNAGKLERIAFFNDDIRDTIKGSVFDALDKGFVNGKSNLENAIQYCVVGATPHNEVVDKTPWAKEPYQSINYVSAHDNYTLWDKLALSCRDESEEIRIRMNKLTCAIVFTAQGIPFFQAGEELLRSKKNEDGTIQDNSYRSSDEVNAIPWANKSKYYHVFQYYKGFIKLRKKFSEFRMISASEVKERLHFLSNLEDNVVAYTIDSKIDSRKSVLVIYNANQYDVTLTIKDGLWEIYADDDQVSDQVIRTITGGIITINAISCMVMVLK